MVNKIKVSFFDTRLIKEFFVFVGLISGLYSFLTIFYNLSISFKNKLVPIAIILCLYLLLWFRANRMSRINLRINGSTLEVKVGNIFDERGYKVIAFNEYFDTQVDDVIIAEKSLNGLVIKEKIDVSVEELDSCIEEYLKTRSNIKSSINENREMGKKKKYPLGTICKYKNEYLFTALTRFDRNNKAELFLDEYMQTLLNFWKEVDIIYASNSIVLPLLGSGQTRIKDSIDISDQDLLEIIIWSFKISRIRVNYPAKISIIIHPDKKDKINFFKLRGMF